MIELLEDDNRLLDILIDEYHLDRHSKYLEKLKRDELLLLVLDKGACHAKETGLYSVCDLLNGYDDTIKGYFKTYTGNHLVEAIIDDDYLLETLLDIGKRLLNEDYEIQHEIIM